MDRRANRKIQVARRLSFWPGAPHRPHRQGRSECVTRPGVADLGDRRAAGRPSIETAPLRRSSQDARFLTINLPPAARKNPGEAWFRAYRGESCSYPHAARPSIFCRAVLCPSALRVNLEKARTLAARAMLRRHQFAASPVQGSRTTRRGQAPATKQASVWTSLWTWNAWAVSMSLELAPELAP